MKRLNGGLPRAVPAAMASGRKGPAEGSVIKARRRGSALAPFLVALAVGALPAAAQGPDQREYAVKAAFLFHLTQFVDWPSESMPAPGEPIRIGVAHPNPFGRLLEEIVEDTVVHDHPLAVEYLEASLKAEDCQIVFVPADAPPHMTQGLLRDLGTEPILLVGENRRFLEEGGMVALLREGDRVVIEINLSALRQANLTASSRLLRLARIMNDVPP